MKEVSTRSASLLLDAIEARGLDADAVWAGLPVSRAVLSAGSERIDWKVWVEMMARAEDACGGPAETERLFKRGAGARVKHPFVRVANAFLSLDDIYALFARWGLTRNLMMQARFERIDAARAHFTVDIAPERVGSLPTLRFVVGVLRNLPGLHGLAEAEVTMLPGATPHHAEYRLVLPPKRSARARLRGLFSLVSGASAALDELADQVRATGIAVTLAVVGSRTALSPGVELTTYRVVQEAATNVLKHAESPTRLDVEIELRPDAVVIDVRDDGAPCGPSRPTDGLGLFGMRERVASYGGEVDAGPMPDGGWWVRAVLPMIGDRARGSLDA